jgi:hypothetical protein
MKLLPILALLASNYIYALPNCPICGTETLLVSEQKDDTSKPSRNISVWNRSMCGNSMFKGESSICPKDDYAYDASMMKWWMLSLENKDGFSLPLKNSVYEFPVSAEADSRVVYSQQFITKDTVRHSLSFWCKTDNDYFQVIRNYAKKSGLDLEIKVDRRENRSFVTVETISMKELNAPRLKHLE